ncbi:MAG: hypothetical protein RJA22_3057 [Verrucomicrobiota bacterium]|jgi:hypothetical protein
MSFFSAFFLWLVMAAVLVAAVVVAIKSSILFLVGALTVFTLLFVWHGCLAHH